MRRVVRSPFPVLGLVLLVGCSGLTSPRPSSDDRGTLVAEVNELRRQAARAEVELANLRRRVLQLEAELGVEPPTGARRVTAPEQPLARESRPSVAEPREVPEVVVSTAPAPPARTPLIEETELDPEPTPSSPPPRAPTASPVAGSPAPTAAPEGEVTVERPILGTVTAEGRALYDEAYTLYHEGTYDEAESKFLEFLSLGPANELSDNALFWVGSTRYARGDYPGALRAFRETVESYPDQNKVPDALYKIGQCLEQVGDLESALVVYRELTTRFPETAAATLASERLAEP